MNAMRNLGMAWFLAGFTALLGAALLGWSILTPPPPLAVHALPSGPGPAALVEALTAGDRGALVEDLRSVAALLQGADMPPQARIARARLEAVAAAEERRAQEAPPALVLTGLAQRLDATVQALRAQAPQGSADPRMLVAAGMALFATLIALAQAARPRELAEASLDTTPANLAIAALKLEAAAIGQRLAEVDQASRRFEVAARVAEVQLVGTAGRVEEAAQRLTSLPETVGSAQESLERLAARLEATTAELGAWQAVAPALVESTTRLDATLTESTARLDATLAEGSALLDAVLTQGAARLNATLGESSDHLNATLSESSARLDAAMSESSARLDAATLGLEAQAADPSASLREAAHDLAGHARHLGEQVTRRVEAGLAPLYPLAERVEAALDKGEAMARLTGLPDQIVATVEVRLCDATEKLEAAVAAAAQLGPVLEARLWPQLEKLAAGAAEAPAALLQAADRLSESVAAAGVQFGTALEAQLGPQIDRLNALHHAATEAPAALHHASAQLVEAVDATLHRMGGMAAEERARAGESFATLAERLTAAASLSGERLAEGAAALEAAAQSLRAQLDLPAAPVSLIPPRLPAPLTDTAAGRLLEEIADLPAPDSLHAALLHFGAVEDEVAALLEAAEALAEESSGSDPLALPTAVARHTPALLDSLGQAIERLEAVATALAVAGDAALGQSKPQAAAA